MSYAPYSFSKLQLAHCPFAFRKKYIEKIPEVTSPNALFGKVVHAIIADIIKNQVMERSYDLAELFDQHMPQSLVPRTREIQDILDIFRQRFSFDKDDVVGVEEKIALDSYGNLCDWDQSFLRGVLDLIEIKGGKGFITDHKTQYNILSQEEMDRNGQLTMYCLLAKAAYPQLQSFDVKIYFARYGAYRSSTRTQKDLELFDMELKLAIDKLESITEWVPVAGASCTFCGYMSQCPLAIYDPRGTDLPQVVTDQQAIELARLLRVREEQIKKQKALLQQYCSQHGDVVISDDYCYGYVSTDTTEWPIAETEQALSRHGQNILDHVTVAKRSIDKLLSQSHRLDPDLYETLSAVGIPKTTTSFRGHRPKEEK